MAVVNTGSYVVQRKEGEKLVIEWSKLSALSEEFYEKMRSLARLGMSSFCSVETDFLSKNPQAAEEDIRLESFRELKGDELESAMNARLHKMFHTHPSELSAKLRAHMSEVCYYFVTIKDETSKEIQGFITFMTGGPVAENEYKITVLAVDESARRTGLASLLINSLKQIGVFPKRVYVCTRPSNIAAIKAYKKWGFIEDLETQKNAPPHFIKGHWIHLTRFE